jgi:hypothetical protein
MTYPVLSPKGPKPAAEWTEQLQHVATEQMEHPKSAIPPATTDYSNALCMLDILAKRFR